MNALNNFLIAMASRISRQSPLVAISPFVVIAITVLSAPVFSQEASTIRGRVVTPGGEVIADAEVYTSRVFTNDPGRSLVIVRSKTGQDGDFELKGVQEGEYRICVSKPSDRILDPCLWSPESTPLIVGPNQIQEGIEIQVSSGYAARIRISDPSHVLDRAQAKEDMAELIVGLPLPSGLFHASIPRGLSSEPGIYESELIVPMTSSPSVKVFAINAKVTDAQGRDFAESVPTLRINPPSQGDSTQVSITVGRVSAQP